MIRNPVLDDIRSNIHSKPIPWNGLVRTEIVPESSVQSFESLGKLSAANRREKVQSESGKYVELVVQLLNKDIRDDIVKYLILFVIEYGDEVSSFADALAKNPGTFDALTRFLKSRDQQIAILGAVSLTSLAGSRVLAPESSVVLCYKYIVGNLLKNDRKDVYIKDLGAQLLSRLCQDPRYRLGFRPFEAEAVPILCELVKSGPLQVQYTSMLTLWILSFEKDNASQFFTEYNVVPTILEAVKAAIKEKIVRIGVAILANLVRFVPKQAVPVLIAEGALMTCKMIAARKWSDEELQADLTYLTETLTTEFDNMTTFEEYESELKAGRLRWTPVHKNKAFWIENIGHFRQHDWAALKQLIKLVKESNDDVTLAVACHDMSALVDEDPKATEVVASNGGKVRLLELISSSDTEVRYEALKATQKMLAHIFAV